MVVSPWEQKQTNKKKNKQKQTNKQNKKIKNKKRLTKIY
jgi:hypothetical protein